MTVAHKSIQLLAALVFTLFSTIMFAQHDDHGVEAKKHDTHVTVGNPVDTKEEINAYSQHHLKDSHDFTFYIDATTGEAVGVSLPVIVWTSKGLKTFMSSEFHHNDDGHVIVDQGDVKLAKIHSKIYELDAGVSTVVFDEAHHATNG